MKTVLIGSSVVLFIFGIILLIRPDVEKKISDWLNRTLISVEDKMRSSNKLSGILLMVLGVVVYLLAVKK
jgi:uncharacterized protein YjeT (DUF2065 family)